MSSPGFADGFGRRSGPAPGDLPALESLRLCDELSQAAGVEEALADRVARLASFEHQGFAATRAVGRDRDSIVLHSDAVPGERLSEILRAAERRWLDPDLAFALAVLQQAAAAVAALHEHGAHLAHGTLGPERIVVRPDGVVVVVEAPLAAALDCTETGRTRLWKQFRVAVPPVAGSPSLDQVADVMQLGVLAVALTRGRLLGRDDFPARLPALLHEAAAADPLGHRPVVPRAVRSWISRSLQLDSRAAFRSGPEAGAALARAIEESGLGTLAPQHVEAWASAALTGQPLAAAPVLAPAPAPTPSPAPDDQVPQAAVPVSRMPRTDRTRERSPSRTPAARPRATRWARGAAIIAGLVLVWGIAYLGARSYLGFPSFLFPAGHLVVESQPAGLEVLLDGKAMGSTPVAVDVRPGRYTLALRSSRSTTLVPVTVESGAWHLERISVRRGRPPVRTSTVRRTPGSGAETGASK